MRARHIITWFMLAGAALPGCGKSHKVELRWDPAKGTVTYNLYRTGPVRGDQKFKKINPEPLKQPSFTDKHVKAGARYEYYVTSVNAQGGESGPSNLMVVSVPYP